MKKRPLELQKEVRAIVEITKPLDYTSSNNGKIILKNSTVDKVVKEVFNTIKTELPEEAQTVEVLEYIVSKLKDRIKECPLKL